MSVILKRLATAGLSIHLEGSDLRVGPRRLLTPELRALLVKHKPRLLKLKALQPVPVQVWPRPGYQSAELVQLLATPVRSCQDCARLEGWTFCGYYQRDLAVPEQVCRCVRWTDSISTAQVACQPWAGHRDAPKQEPLLHKVTERKARHVVT